MTHQSLHHVPVGGSAEIVKLRDKGSIRRRLLDMGLTAGTKTTCLFQSPSGDPRAYRVRGAVVAIRSEDAKQIEVIFSTE